MGAIAPVAIASVKKLRRLANVSRAELCNIMLPNSTIASPSVTLSTKLHAFIFYLSLHRANEFNERLNASSLLSVG
jgi:hypothetical protein